MLITEMRPLPRNSSTPLTERALRFAAAPAAKPLTVEVVAGHFFTRHRVLFWIAYCQSCFLQKRQPTFW